MRNTPFGKVLLARVLAGSAIATGMSLVLAAPAQAQAGAQVKLNVKAGPLSAALNDFASQTGYQLLYPSDLVAGKTSSGASGAMSVNDGLGRVLAGTGLGFTLLDGKTIQISAANAGADGEVVTGAVNVEGVQGSPWFGGAGQAAGVNGINGSRDITATEGTGSFTSGALTIGSKVPQALKDVPQSISVLTSERLEQQNVTDFTTAMAQLPGISVVQGTSSLENTFYARGFEIRSIQVDGGAPLITSSNSLSQFYFPQIDMAQYDHVELLRGADGTFNGYGDPGGSVNLVRKRPLDHSQFLTEAQLGSWSNYRVMTDASSPLALDGKLRGRLVMTWQDNHHFYDTAKDDKILIYGIAEFDVTPSTLVTAGLSYTKQNSLPWLNGLPRYQDGADLKLPRSTCLCFDWNRWNFDTTEFFGGIEQRIGNEWTAKINLTRNQQTSIQKAGYSSGSVNPLTDAGPLLTGSYYGYSSKQFSAETTLAGSFEIFGQRQEITVGANRVYSDAGGQTSYASLITGTSAAPYQPYPGGPLYYSGSGSPNGARPPINVFTFDPANPIFTEPRNSLPSVAYPVNEQVQSVIYANLRLTAFDRFHLITAFRWSRSSYKYRGEEICYSIPSTGTPSDTNCVGRAIGDHYNISRLNYADNDISWPPSVTLSFDVTKALSAYLGYTDIYQTQANYLDQDLNPVGPITGSNIETGLKWQARGGRLNISLSGYRIRQKGFAMFDGEYDYNVTDEDIANGIYSYFVAPNGRRVANGMIDASHYCCVVSNPDQTLKSDGFDLDLTGEVESGWQVSVSTTYNRTKQVGSYYGANDGLPLISIQPHYLYKIWTSFDFGTAGLTGWLAGLTLSGGVNGQSSGFRSGTACAELNPPNALGVSTCKAGATVPFSFIVSPYAVVAARIDYRLSKTWSLAINLDNILDKTYYQSVGASPVAGNWYGTPRSFTATLRAKW